MKKAIASALQSILVLLILIPTIAHSQTTVIVDNLKYTLDPKTQTATVTGPANSETVINNLVIPEKITSDETEYTVTGIGKSAFEYSYARISGTLSLPSSIKEIGYNAFSGCFNLSGTLTIPENIYKIGEDAFRGCSGFTTLSLPNSMTRIPPGMFYECSGFQGELILPSSIKEIGNYAFTRCTGFTGKLYIPNTVKSLGYNAFSGCSGFTGSLTIPNSITKIWTGTFEGCTGLNGELKLPDTLEEIENDAFKECSGLTGTLVIPNTVIRIGAYAFYKCSGFTGPLTIPNSVTRLGSYTFGYCTGFQNLSLSNSLISIPERAFCDCTGFFGTLTIPDLVNDIGTGAFSGCSGFTGNLVFPNSVTKFGPYAFFDCAGFDGTLTLPDGIEAINTGTFARCSNLTGTLIIPNSCNTICDGAFAGCSGFTGELLIPTSVTSIERTAFSGCSGFSSLKIDGPITQIAESTFQNCTGLTTIEIPNTVEEIWYCAFQDVPADIIKLPASLKKIYDCAFYGKMPKKIISEATIPPTTITGFKGYEVFNSYSGSEDYEVYYETVPLYVPKESIEQYKKGRGEWRWFKKIYAIGEVVAESITLDQDILTLQERQEAILVATILPETTTDKSVTWKSSDESVATVDASGKITAVGVGSTTITVTAKSGVTATCEITVVETPATGIVIDWDALGISGDNLEMEVGDTKTIKVTVEPETATDKSITFKSSSPKVATVNADGEITAIGIGQCTITITAASGISASININVIPTVAEIIRLNHTHVSLETSETIALIATISPENTTDKSVAWSSSDENVATVDALGTVTGVTAGKAVITASTTNGVTAKCTVTVVSKATAIGDVTEDADVKVSVADGAIVVTAPVGETVTVYNISGMCVAETKEHRITGLTPGVYLVRVADRTFKVAL